MSTDDKNDGTNTGSEDEALPDFIETEDDATVADSRQQDQIQMA